MPRDPMPIPPTPPDRMSFWEHLQELRVRIVRSLLIVAVGFATTYLPLAYALQYVDWLIHVCSCKASNSRYSYTCCLMLLRMCLFGNHLPAVG